jgi:protein-tyrosine phosphatase
MHLLYDIDDGPPDLQSSVEMIELAARLGYSTLVATPHLLDPLDDAYSARIEDRMRELQPYATSRAVTLQRGFEVRLSPDIGRRLERGESISLANSKTVLVELPFSGWPLFTEHALFDVLAAGFTPLLAHPERYEAAIERPQRVLDLHAQGVLMQITTGSLAGLFGKHAKSLAETLLRAGAVDVLASDAHSAGRRFVSVTEGLSRAEQIAGRERVRQLTVDNPNALLADTALRAALPPGPRTVNGQDRAEPWKMVRSILPRG